MAEAERHRLAGFASRISFGGVRRQPRGLLRQSHGFEGFTLAAKEGPPDQLVVSQHDGLPHRLLDWDAAQRPSHAEMNDRPVASSANVEQLPVHVLESTANRIPPGTDAGVTPEDRSFGLGDHRRELDVLGGERQERFQVARVQRPNASLCQRPLLGAHLQHRPPSICRSQGRVQRGFEPNAYSAVRPRGIGPPSAPETSAPRRMMKLWTRPSSSASRRPRHSGPEIAKKRG